MHREVAEPGGLGHGLAEDEVVLVDAWQAGARGAVVVDDGFAAASAYGPIFFFDPKSTLYVSQAVGLAARMYLQVSEWGPELPAKLRYVVGEPKLVPGAVLIAVPIIVVGPLAPPAHAQNLLVVDGDLQREVLFLFGRPAIVVRHVCYVL